MRRKKETRAFVLEYGNCSHVLFIFYNCTNCITLNMHAHDIWIMRKYFAKQISKRAGAFFYHHLACIKMSSKYICYVFIALKRCIPEQRAIRSSFVSFCAHADLKVNSKRSWPLPYLWCVFFFFAFFAPIVSVWTFPMQCTLFFFSCLLFLFCKPMILFSLCDSQPIFN